MRSSGFLLSFFLIFSPSAGAWNSQFLQPSGPQWTRPVVNAGGRDFQIPDYSYSGYKLSQAGLGDQLPCFSLTITAALGSEISSKLNQAVTTVAAAGGGTVYVPPGYFTLSSTVQVHASNVRIAGAGSAATHLTVTAAYTPGNFLYEGTFHFTGSLSNIALWMEQPRSVTSTRATADIPLGASAVTCLNAAIFSPGDWVVVQQFFTASFVLQNSNNTWPLVPASQSQYEFSQCYLRRAVSVAGSTLNLDAPIPKTLATASNTIHVYRPRASDFIENVGLEGMTISAAPTANDAGLPAGIAVMFKGVFNAWARDVQLNNIARHGFQPIWSARSTFLDCHVDGAQYLGGGGNGYGFHINASQAVLIRRSSSSDARHNMTTQKPMCSDIVLSRFDSLRTGFNASYLQDDTHHSWAHNVLWDMLNEQGVGLSAMNRGVTSSDAWETFGGGTIWNLTGNGATANPQAGKVQMSPETHTAESEGHVIGVSGGHLCYDGSSFETGSYLTGTLMSGAALQLGPRGNVAYEGLGAAGLDPPSLFEAQLSSRLGAMPPEIAPDLCAATPTPSATPSASPTPSRTGTPSFSETVTPAQSQTASSTPSPCATASPSFSSSPSSTPSPSPTPSGTLTQTATQTASETVGPVLSLTSSTTPSPSPSATLTPVQAGAAAAPGGLSKALPSFNPQSGEPLFISALLEGSADGFVLKLYSKAVALTASFSIEGSYAAGWHDLNFETRGLASGIYFFELQAVYAGKPQGAARLGKLMILK